MGLRASMQLGLYDTGQVPEPGPGEEMLMAAHY